MTQKNDFLTYSSEAIMEVLFDRLEEIRLSRNISQANLAAEAGVSRSTITRLARGENISVDSFVRIMQALGLTDNLAALLPNPKIRPVERIRMDGAERVRASSKQKSTAEWRWGRHRVTDTARVILWGRDIGAITWIDARGLGVFQYTPEFAESQIQVAPLMMPLRPAPYEFPTLSNDTFNGLPGLLADSLPDKFGNALINAWLASQNRPPASFTPVERLCYIGAHGIGALEFRPSAGADASTARRIEIEALVELANRVLDERVGIGRPTHKRRRPKRDSGHIARWHVSWWRTCQGGAGME